MGFVVNAELFHSEETNVGFKLNDELHFIFTRQDFLQENLFLVFIPNVLSIFSDLETNFLTMYQC